MSMRDEMSRETRRQCEEGELVLVEPTIPCSQIRPVYMARKAYARVFGPNAEESERMGFLEADLRRFISGDKITVARGKEASCILKPLSNVIEVWELRSKDPPAIRLFGRFADKDVFIATNLEYRSLLYEIKSRFWAVQMRRCQAIWNRLFPYIDPHRGETSHDYVSNAIDLDHDVP
jgi:hypothetical protein